METGGASVIGIYLRSATAPVVADVGVTAPDSRDDPTRRVGCRFNGRGLMPDREATAELARHMADLHRLGKERLTVEYHTRASSVPSRQGR